MYSILVSLFTKFSQFLIVTLSSPMSNGHQPVTHVTLYTARDG